MIIVKIASWIFELNSAVHFCLNSGCGQSDAEDTSKRLIDQSG